MESWLSLDLGVHRSWSRAVSRHWRGGCDCNADQYHLAARPPVIVVTDLAASRGVAGQSEAAVRLLGQVTATQPRRVTTASRRLDPVILSTIIESAVPGIYIAVAVFRRGFDQVSTYRADAHLSAGATALAKRILDIRQLTDVLHCNLQHHLSRNCISWSAGSPRHRRFPGRHYDRHISVSGEYPVPDRL